MNNVIFNSVRINWFNINQNKMVDGLKAIGLKPYPVDENQYLIIKDELSYTDANFNIDETYLGLRLYDLTIYSICNDLILFRDELNLDLDLHKTTVIKWFSIAKAIINDFETIFKNYKFSLVLVVNGHSLIDACLLTFAKSYKLPFLCIENTSHKDRVVWDNKTGKVITFNLSKLFFEKFKNKVTVRQVEDYANSFKNTVFKIKKEEHLSNLNSNEIPFDKPYVLYLAQVYCDAAQLFAINDSLRNPINAISSVIEVCKNINMPLVIKLHPKESSGKSPVVDKPYDSPTYKRLQAYELDNVFIDHQNTYNTYKLIEASQVVVTLNSQAGLEACLYNKPVLSYTNSFYSNLGFTYDFDSLGKLKSCLTDLINNQAIDNRDTLQAKTFYYIFFEKYCILNTLDSLLQKVIDTGVFNSSILLKIRFMKLNKSIKSKIRPILRILKKMIND